MLWITAYHAVADNLQPSGCRIPASFLFALRSLERQSGCVEDVQTRSSVCRFLTQNNRATSAQIYDARSSSVHCLLAQRPLVMDVTRCPSRSHFSVCLHAGGGSVWLRGCLLAGINTSRIQCRDAARVRSLPRQTDSSSADGLYR